MANKSQLLAEREHYAFIVLHEAGRLGVDGKGKAPHWRLTELGNTSRASADGLLDPPARDYLRWDGVLFDPKPFRRGSKWDYEKQNPASHVRSTPLSTGETPPLSTGETTNPQSVSHVVHIQPNESVSDVVHISSLTTPSESAARSSDSAKPLSEGSFEGENKIGPSENELISALGKWGNNVKRRRATR